MEPVYQSRGGVLPAGFLTTGYVDAPSTETRRTRINVNGTNASRPGQHFNFSIPCGYNTGFFRRKSGYIEGTIKCTINTSSGYFKPGPRGIINGGADTIAEGLRDPSFLHVEPPQFRNNNASHLKKSQRVIIGGTTIYDESNKNVYIEAIESLGGGKNSMTMMESHNNTRKPAFLGKVADVKAVKTGTVITEAAADRVDYTTYEWSFTMRLDCPLFDNDTQDFPLFAVKDVILYEITVDDILERIFDFRCMQVDNFELSGLQLCYESILPGVTFEQTQLAADYEMPFSTQFSGYQSYPTGSTDFRATHACNSLTGLMVVPYHIGIVYPPPDGTKVDATNSIVTHASAIPFVGCARSGYTDKYYMSQGGVTIEDADAVHRGTAMGLGVYGGSDTLFESIDVSIDGVNVLPKRVEPRKRYGEVVQYLRNFVDGHLTRDMRAYDLFSDASPLYGGILGREYFDLDGKDILTQRPNAAITNVLAFDLRRISDRDHKNVGRRTNANVTMHISAPTPEYGQERTIRTVWSTRDDSSSLLTSDYAMYSITEYEARKDSNDPEFWSFPFSPRIGVSGDEKALIQCSELKMRMDRYIYYYLIHERTLNLRNGTAVLSPI